MREEEVAEGVGCGSLTSFSSRLADSLCTADTREK